MRTVEDAKTGIAAVVGRWQVDDLHEAHRALLDEVCKQHRKVIVFVGVAHFLGTCENPLDYPSRERMIRHHYPEVTVLPVLDAYSDEVWSKRLDSAIRMVDPVSEVTLYGGRDSFVRHYKGRFRTVELDALQHPSGTDIRRNVGRVVRSSPDFRAGVIYSTQNRFPLLSPTVDIAVLRPDGKGNVDVLLGKKPTETAWRFPGGFVGPTDSSLEAAVRRELLEETGLEAGEIEYFGSYNVNDWRLTKPEAVMTTFFTAIYSFGGTAKAADDLAELAWVDGRKLLDREFVGDHLQLAKDLYEHLRSQGMGA